VHTRPFVDMQRADDLAKLWPIADEIYTLALQLGGTISTQHGTGLARTPWVAQQYGKLYPVFRKLKSIFDPRHLFNPGKIVGPAPGTPAWPLRRREVRPDAAAGNLHRPEAEGQKPSAADAPGPPQLRWVPGEMAQESHACNGC